MSCISTYPFATRSRLNVVKQQWCVVQIVITKACLLFWFLYNFKSVGSSVKVQTHRQQNSDYSNPPLCLCRRELIICCCVSGMRKSAMITECWTLQKIIGILFSPYRPCAADVRRLNFPNIFHIISGKKRCFFITFSRKRPLTIMCRQYVVQFQLGTTRLLRFIDFQFAVENAASNGLYCTLSCNSKWRIYHIIFTCLNDILLIWVVAQLPPNCIKLKLKFNIMNMYHLWVYVHVCVTIESEL